MKEKEHTEGVFSVVCPCCQAIVWVDSSTQGVVKFEKDGGKKKESLDDLLLRERKRTSEFGRKFEATAELEKKKKEKAKEKFEKALLGFDKDEE